MRVCLEWLGSTDTHLGVLYGVIQRWNDVARMVLSREKTAQDLTEQRIYDRGVDIKG